MNSKVNIYNLQFLLVLRINNDHYLKPEHLWDISSSESLIYNFYFPQFFECMKLTGHTKLGKELKSRLTFLVVAIGDMTAEPWGGEQEIQIGEDAEKCHDILSLDLWLYTEDCGIIGSWKQDRFHRRGQILPYFQQQCSQDKHGFEHVAGPLILLDSMPVCVSQDTTSQSSYPFQWYYTGMCFHFPAL
ncbi:hypothetical protein STEG23_032635, partial [Scotinomys teguina]